MQHRFVSPQPFTLESGAVLEELEIVYHTYGSLNAARSNVVWVCHALTANADAEAWWPGLIGPGAAINPDEYFIVCANILGSCYGSTGPLSINPATGQPYYMRFPQLTIRDLVKAHILLRNHLELPDIFLLMGGSMGGYQVLEWALMEPAVIRQIFLIASSGSESAWGIAIHEAQRMAIEADSSWREEHPQAGAAGLKAARAIGMLTYRNYTAISEQQRDADPDKTDGFKAASYMRYQGEKLVSRFNAQSYWILTKALDSHNIARHRTATLEAALAKIQQPALVMGVSSDLLCPVTEQQKIARSLPQARYIEIDSGYGHDGFLVEAVVIGEQVKHWLER
ncbi:homoserine O-acetyltransferase [Flavihumibacter sp. CACIAM 22H1]|uniref:homoserine O-acetyltransferase MetX n=1 Tax=Flavihumibacter sp. CACIAM 22H1 TaxID=1812911 RepID=UPI0007A8415E|nr:homoserine O-acetyltransferase [Flavihumibacter sp. CACIAM 22H1]KYP14991.1 MAG: homoserine O-acetyltransferase [Flavihumibacter sp. CACIAM 22H1]